MSQRSDELQQWLERFRRGPELVAVASTGAAGAELDWTPDPAKWSIRQIAWHLADAELVTGERLRRVIAEESPTLLAFDQDAWARQLPYYRQGRFSDALDTFRKLRADNYALLESLPEEAFERRGVHSEKGPLTLFDLLRSATEHAENHARQITALRQAYRELRSQRQG